MRSSVSAVERSSGSGAVITVSTVFRYDERRVMMVAVMWSTGVVAALFAGETVEAALGGGHKGEILSCATCWHGARHRRQRQAATPSEKSTPVTASTTSSCLPRHRHRLGRRPRWRLLTDLHFQRGTQCGHLVININGPRCLTGPHGTGESVASVTALGHEVCSRGLPIALLVNRAAQECVSPTSSPACAAVTQLSPKFFSVGSTVLRRFCSTPTTHTHPT